jgi:hypothetical protein
LLVLFGRAILDRFRLKASFQIKAIDDDLSIAVFRVIVPAHTLEHEPRVLGERARGDAHAHRAVLERETAARVGWHERFVDLCGRFGRGRRFDGWGGRRRALFLRLRVGVAEGSTVAEGSYVPPPKAERGAVQFDGHRVFGNLPSSCTIIGAPKNSTRLNFGAENDCSRHTLLNLFTRKTPAPPGASAVPLALLPVLRTAPDPNTLYIIPRVRVADTGEITHLDNAARHHTRLFLTGSAGMGKSSALQFIAARAGHGASLQSFADFHPRALPEDFRDVGWILFDDVTDPAHVAHLETLAQKYLHAKIAAVAADTARVPTGFTHLELLPFNEREIVSFAEAWFPLPEGGHRSSRLNRAAQDFIASLQANAGARELAITPLYLFLLLQVYEPATQREPQTRAAEKIALPVVGSDGIARAAEMGASMRVPPSNPATPFDVPQRTQIAPLPARRAALFDAYVNAKLARESDPEFAARALEGIALSTKRGQLAQDEHLARGYDFLYARASGRIAFKHALLQDFLAARALRRNPDFAPMQEHLLDPAWREVVLFYAGLGAADDVVSAAIAHDDFIFAAYALAASPEPSAFTDQVVKELVARAWDNYDENAMRALGALRSNSASDFFAAKLRDKNADARLRAAYILGKLHTDRALEYLLPQLRDPSAEVRAQVIASLGQSRSERVVEPLLVALRGDPRVASSDIQLKIAAAHALGEYGTDKAVPALLVDMQVGEGELQTQAMAALQKIRSAFAVKPLESIAAADKRDHVRAAAAQVLQDMAGM